MLAFASCADSVSSGPPRRTQHTCTCAVVSRVGSHGSAGMLETQLERGQLLRLRGLPLGDGPGRPRELENCTARYCSPHPPTSSVVSVAFPTELRGQCFVVQNQYIQILLSRDSIKDVRHVKRGMSVYVSSRDESGRVLAPAPDGSRLALVQLDSGADVIEVAAEGLKLCSGFHSAGSLRSPKSLLMLHQHRCIQKALEWGRLLAVMETATGKTLTGVGLLIQLFRRDQSNLRALVVAPANVLQIWEKNVRHEMPDVLQRRIHFQSSTKVGRGLQQLRAESFLCMILDEAQVGKNCTAIHSELCGISGRTKYVLALTATPMTVSTDQMANVCQAAGLAKKWCSEAFWTPREASIEKQVQEMEREGPLFRYERSARNEADPSDTSVPRLLPDHCQEYRSGGTTARNTRQHSFAETFAVDPTSAKELMKLEVHSSKLRQRALLVASSVDTKLGATVGVVKALMTGQINGRKHAKIVVAHTYVYLATVLSDVFRACIPEATIFLYQSEQTRNETLRANSHGPHCASLQSFLQHDGCAILIMSLALGAVGISLVNGPLSASAVVVYEVPLSDANSNQLVGRLVRPGGAELVQRVLLEGGMNTRQLELNLGHREKADDIGITQGKANAGVAPRPSDVQNSENKPAKKRRSTET